MRTHQVSALNKGFTPTDEEIAQADLFREPTQRRRRHDGCLDLRLLPFVVLRELAEEQIGNDEAEHGVAEELERLVVEHAAAGVLVHARPVCERVFEEPGPRRALGLATAAALLWLAVRVLRA